MKNNKVDMDRLRYLRTIDYVTDSSCYTRPSPSPGEPGHVSKDYQRDKDYIDLDYSDIPYQKVYFEDEEFIKFNSNNTPKKKPRILSKTLSKQAFK